jgi:thiamine pyrophosphate-dependent acetolactate synthase large subunit-like protein
LSNDIDYVAFARSLGGEGFKITSTDEVKDVLDQVFASNKTVVVNCIVEQSSNVFPMVPPGKAIFEAINE